VTSQEVLRLASNTNPPNHPSILPIASHTNLHHG
jgi:hypothetical protein